MTKVVVHSGICGNTTTIEVVGLPERKVRVGIKSSCKKVGQIDGRLEEVDWMSLMTQRGEGYSAYQAVMQYGGHMTCPIPVAIIKAIEVEAGMALPKDVTIEFKSDK